MPRFRFKLQPVLSLREREEAECQRVVADLERARIELESQIRACQQRIASGRRELASAIAPGQPADLRHARLQAGATLRDDQQARFAVLTLAGVHKRLETARKALAQAATRRRAMELLRDTQRDRFNAEQARLEALALDDLTIMRHGARSDP